MRFRLKVLFIIIFLPACTMAPQYHRPKADVSFAEPTDSSKIKIGKISWEKFFTSSDLQRIINLALENNKDLKVAELNIEAARAQHGIARSNLMPTINATSYETRQKAPSSFASFTPKRQFRANLNTTSYEIDFFGRLQSLKKAAYEDFLSSKEAKNVTKILIIAETVNSYAKLLLDQKNLKIAEQLLEIQEEKFHISEVRYANGIDSKTTLLNTKALYEDARANLESYKKNIEQDKNALMIITGIFDERSLPQEDDVDDITINEDLLDLVPSESLLSRPDIQEAEHKLKSANANIGAARAAFFPSISLTGTYGYASRDASNLFSSRTWTFTPQINLPIFEGGKNIANLSLANVQKKIEIINYQKAIQTAFREALDELIERKTVLNRLKSFDEIFTIKKESLIISQKKYDQGIDSKNDFLDAKITFLTANLNRNLVKKEYITNLVNLYKVLGGGSEVEKDNF